VNNLSNSTDVVRPFDPKRDGAWTRQNATHLLWRARFGASFEQIQTSTADGLDRSVEKLLTPQKDSDDFKVAEPLLRQTAHQTGNIADLKAWWLYRMLYSANPLVEKMSLLWHNQFATSYSKVQSVDHMAAQNDLIRQHAVGSFRDLLHGMARDVAMLIWLDSNSNRKRHANENFSREVMELFSLGEGNYTEVDIKQAARAFTGWHVRDDKFWFNRIQHDFTEKTVFGKTGKFDGDELIDLCLEHKACPRFLATKLLTTFVTPRPGTEVVDGLASRIRTHDYDMSKVLRELFRSAYFFSDEVQRSIIKSPLDLVLGSIRSLDGRANLQNAARLLAELGQDVFEPPTVKGWEGGRLWISSATLLQRANFAAELTKGNDLGPIRDPGSTAVKFGWNDDDAAIHYFVGLLLARELQPAAIEQLREYMRGVKADRGNRLRGLIHLVMTMPEFQLV